MNFIKLTILSLFLVSAIQINAQSDLEIYGFYQVRLEDFNMKLKVSGDLQTPFGPHEIVFADMKQKNLSPYMQQANIFLRKEFGSDFTSFMNFEFVNNFSTENLWGSFKIDEAWLNYEYDPALNIKAGYLIPKFNYLNEVKNRMPLLPYIIRPLIYESSLTGVIDPSDFLPEKAFLQVHGKLFLGDLGLNYAVYAGQAESGYISNKNAGEITNSATDTSKFKLFGGRIGLNYGSLRLGLSSSQDRDNLTSTIGENVLRRRYGADIGFNFNNFFLDAEIIKVDLDAHNTTVNLDKLFYYVTLEYDFNEQFFVYGSYSAIENKADEKANKGFTGGLLGSGYKLTNDIVLKCQYVWNEAKSEALIPVDPQLPPVKAESNLDINVFLVAISIMF